PQHLLGRVGDDEVIAVVDDGMRAGPLVILLDHLAQRLAAVLGGEGDDGRGAAECGGSGAAQKVVGAHQPERGLLGDVAMALDPARQHEFAASIDLLGAGPQLVGESGDAAIADTDVAADAVTGGDDRAAADDEVEGPAHWLLPWR